MRHLHKFDVSLGKKSERRHLAAVCGKEACLPPPPQRGISLSQPGKLARIFARGRREGCYSPFFYRPFFICSMGKSCACVRRRMSKKVSKEATDRSRPSSTKLLESRAFLLLPIISPPLFFRRSKFAFEKDYPCIYVLVGGGGEG